MSFSDNLEFKFLHLLGEGRNSSAVEEVNDADVVSAIEFDDTGDFLAVGDKGGRIVLFERDEKRSKKSDGKKQSKNPEYKFLAEFQSHEPEFDYLKSLEIEEKINKIKWCKRQSEAHFLLSTNDKTIKLWKSYEKKIKAVANFNLDKTATKPAKVSSLKIPQVDNRDSVMVAVPRRIYANAHAYHINSISISSDGETYISSDDLRINLWNLNINDQSFNIVDIKPVNMEELTEVITSAEFHPNHCNLFMYSSSKGTIKLADMRTSALCDRQAKVFEESEDVSAKSFFYEIISSTSDIKFSRDGRYIISRDYMTVKVWDINMENKPVKTIHVHDYLRAKLCDLYENDCIFDKFECAFNYDGNLIATGTYHNMFNIYDRSGKNEATLEATKIASKVKKPVKLKPAKKKTKDELNPDALDLTRKVLHLAWHPHENLLAAGANNNIFLFNAQ